MNKFGDFYIGLKSTQVKEADFPFMAKIVQVGEHFEFE